MFASFIEVGSLLSSKYPEKKFTDSELLFLKFFKLQQNFLFAATSLIKWNSVLGESSTKMSGDPCGVTIVLLVHDGMECKN